MQLDLGSVGMLMTSCYILVWLLSIIYTLQKQVVMLAKYLVTTIKQQDMCTPAEETMTINV